MKTTAAKYIASTFIAALVLGTFVLMALFFGGRI